MRLAFIYFVALALSMTLFSIGIQLLPAEHAGKLIAAGGLLAVSTILTYLAECQQEVKNKKCKL